MSFINCMKIDSRNNINFGAYHFARCQNLNINIHKISNNSDIKALQKFCDTVDFNELMPDLTRNNADRWHEMLELVTDSAKNPGNVTYVETINNKICGIVSYFPNPTTFIDCICTIPVNIGEKVKLAGKALFCQVFSDFEKYNGSKIKLKAITNGPYDTVNKYKELGFKETHNVTSTYSEMEVNKHVVKNELQRLKNIVGYNEVEPENINLDEMF